MTEIPEEEWEIVQKLADTIKRQAWKQTEDVENLDNLLHALHGEGIRNSKYSPDGTPCVFVDGKWISRTKGGAR